MNEVTITVPEAGMRYFGLSRNASYAAAKRGEIPTIRIGKLYRVPVHLMEKMVGASFDRAPKVRDVDILTDWKRSAAKKLAQM